MTPDDYIAQRVDDQIAWYSRRSASNQRAFERLRLVEIVAAAMIPLLSGILYQELGGKILVGMLGFGVAVIAGVLSLFQFQENWTRYRATCEALKQEKLLFLTGTTPYDGADPFADFVTRVESLLEREHATWAGRTRKRPAPDQAKLGK